MASVTKPNLLQSEAYSIDSLKIRIPLAQIEVLNESIMHHWVRMNEGTGEIDESEFKSKAYWHQSNGYSTKYLVQELVMYGKPLTEYLILGISAKLLESRYQEGITPETLPTLYSQLIVQGEVKLTYDTFKQGVVSDIDIKQDFHADYDLMTEIRETLYDFSIIHKEIHKGPNPFRGSTNQGIEWNKRETACIKTAPYVKIYNKSLELTHKSKLFKHEHLHEYDCEGVARVEATLKNKKALEHYGIDNTLYELVNTPQSTFKQVIDYAIATNIEGYQRKASTMESKSAREKIILSVIGFALNRGMSLSEIYAMTLSQFESGSHRRKARAEITKLYEQLLASGSIENMNQKEANDRIKKANEVNRILTDILGV